MNPSDSVKNIVSNILDISTKDIIFLTHHLHRELSFRQVEESEGGLGIRTINNFTGKKSVNQELLTRLYKKQQRDLRDKLEADKKHVLKQQADQQADLDEQAEIEKDYQCLLSEHLSELEPYTTYDADCFVNKPEVRKQKNIKPVYKNLRLKSQKRLDKERRAKRKPVGLFI